MGINKWSTVESKFNPRCLDVAVFALQGAVLSGSDPLLEYARLAQDLDGIDSDTTVEWQARGASRRLADGGDRLTLDLQARTVLPLICQRCLTKAPTPIEVDRHFVLVADEQTAARLDAESDDDVIVLARDFDVRGLVEDELIMALPLVPRHEHCPEPLQSSTQTADFEASMARDASPFDVLAGYKTKKRQ